MQSSSGLALLGSGNCVLSVNIFCAMKVRGQGPHDRLLAASTVIKGFIEIFGEAHSEPMRKVFLSMGVWAGVLVVMSRAR